jgi:hypothetical protein
MDGFHNEASRGDATGREDNSGKKKSPRAKNAVFKYDYDKAVSFS